MGFRNPIRSLPADDITGGQFTDAYTLSGTLVVGNPAGAHIKLDGSVPSEKLYAADGVTVLVDIEPTGSTFTGKVQTGVGGQRVVLDPNASVFTSFPAGEALLLYTGSAAEKGPGQVIGYYPGSRPQIRLVPAFFAGADASQWLNESQVAIEGSLADGTYGDITISGSADVHITAINPVTSAFGTVALQENGGPVSIGGAGFASSGYLEIFNRTTNPAAPSAGIRLYAKGGHLWAVGSSFAATQIL